MGCSTAEHGHFSRSARLRPGGAEALAVDAIAQLRRWAAESRIKAAEATEAARKDEHAKAGNVMALYRQMMQGGGAGGVEKEETGGSGSGEGSGSPDMSTGSIVEEFEFDSIGSGSGSLSGGAWGRAPDDDAGDDDDDGW